MNIQMGNDEFILYIRKNQSNAARATADLGRKIWEWIRANDPNARIVQHNVPCHWGSTGSFIADDNLPKTATQFTFNRTLLPQLYEYLDTLC